MIEEDNEHFTDDNDGARYYAEPYDKLLNDDNVYEELDPLFQDRLDYEAIGEKYEIKRDQLTIIKLINRGYYSDIHMGMLSLSPGSVTVAVKMPQLYTDSINAIEREDTLRRQRRALRDELNIFVHLQSSSAGGHENVLKLIGAITTIKNDFCLLTEYCDRGSMDCFLQTKRGNGEFEDELIYETNKSGEVWKAQRDPSWGENYQSRRENGLITTSDLLWFALQIADAMQFLTEKNVIHRDAAVRNILLKYDFTVKVAEFGLARKLEDSDTACYVWKKDSAIPIRHIAPEALKSGQFAVTSEFWSFGVVVWELFTFAENKPYSVEFENYNGNLQFYEFVVDHLSSGHRLSIPNNVPQQIKSLLSRLWHSDPKQRPSFQVCRKLIKQELMQSCPNMLSKEKAPHHTSKYSLFRYDNEEANERAPKSLESSPLEIALPSKEIQKRINHKSLERKKVKFRIIVSVGLLSFVLIAMLTGLGFSLLFTSLSAKENVLSNSTFPKVSSVHRNNTSDLNSHEAVNQLIIAAEQGNATAQEKLGWMYQYGLGVDLSDETAVKWYTKSAEQGNAKAQEKLGWMYQTEQGVNRSYAEAVKWYTKSAEQGDANGQEKLGWMYQYGNGVPKSEETAVKWYTVSAEKGNANAQEKLGWMYQYGNGVPQSDAEAVKWYTKSANQGNAKAQNTLGLMYRDGKGVPQSDEEAVKWFRKLAEQGDANARLNLGLMYHQGRGVKQSDEEAVKWYTESAEQGDANAQYYLGTMYEEGQGVPKSDVDAIKWYRKSAKQGNEHARASLKKLSKKG